MKIIECPRDAMQGLKEFIPTEKKINYINQLLKVQFDTIDFGSFVSPRAIPQMSDTANVLDQLDDKGNTKLLAIIANFRGAEAAASYEQIDCLGFPFSISETFQQRNTNSSISQALERIDQIQDLCVNKNKTLVCYISMGFGNPYGDLYEIDLVLEYTKKLIEKGISTISLADTIGVATPDQIGVLYKSLCNTFPDIEFGAHLHSTPASAHGKIEAAYVSGCRRFDGAIRGYGGCPMAKDELTGNMATEQIIDYLDAQNDPLPIEMDQFRKAIDLSIEIFPK